MRVLIVEDNEDSRVLLETVFAAQGHAVDSAANGNLALEAMKEKRPDLIVSDILMPEMDGYAFCQAVKSDPGARDIPFVFYSATFTDPGDIRYAMDLGASRFIVKPQEIDVFLREVDEVMAEHRAGTLPDGRMGIDNGEAGLRHAEVLFRKLDEKVRDLEKERARLRHSEERFSALVRHAPVGFFSVTPDGWLLEANGAMADMLGYGSEMELLSDVDMPRHPYLGEEQKDDLPGMLRDHPDGAQMTGKILLRNGREARLALTIWPVLDGRGSVDRLEGVAMDITRQQLAEEYLVHMEKSMAVGGVAAGMAHEINSPLATILGNLQVVERRLTLCKGPNVKAAEETGLDWNAMAGYLGRRNILEMLTVARNAALRTSTIVKNMLRYSRRTEFNCSPQDIVSVLEATVELASTDYELKKRFNFRAIPMDREFYVNLPRVECDPDTMQQVFFNILKNGAEAMTTAGAGGRAPRFVLRALPDEGYVRVEIEDNGPGMDEDVRTRLFEPFFTTKHDGKGTGLGLSISHFIVTEKHGGELLVESEPGRGSTFIIRLPLARQAAEICG